MEQITNFLRANKDKLEGAKSIDDLLSFPEEAHEQQTMENIFMVYQKNRYLYTLRLRDRWLKIDTRIDT